MFNEWNLISISENIHNDKKQWKDILAVHDNLHEVLFNIDYPRGDCRNNPGSYKMQMYRAYVSAYFSSMF